MLREELAGLEAAAQLDQRALDALELALRRFVERGERTEHHEHLRAALTRLKERLEPLVVDLSVEPELRRSAQAVVRLVDRALRAMDFARRLRELRKQKGLTVERLADLAGINVSILYRLERGGFAPPSRRTLQRLAHALQVRLDDLAPTQRMGEEPVELAEVVGLLPRLDPLSREERLLLQDLIDWWAVRREQYLVLGPVGAGQQRTLQLVRELVRVLVGDAEEVRELRWAVLERVARANGEELRQVAGCMAIERRGDGKEPRATD